MRTHTYTPGGVGTYEKFKIEIRLSGKRCFRVLYRRLRLDEALRKLAVMTNAARAGRGRRGVVRLVDSHGKRREEIDMVAVWKDHVRAVELEAQGRVADCVTNPKFQED